MKTDYFVVRMSREFGDPQKKDLKGRISRALKETKFYYLHTNPNVWIAKINPDLSIKFLDEIDAEQAKKDPRTLSVYEVDITAKLMEDQALTYAETEERDGIKKRFTEELMGSKGIYDDSDRSYRLDNKGDVIVRISYDELKGRNTPIAISALMKEKFIERYGKKIAEEGIESALKDDGGIYKKLVVLAEEYSYKLVSYSLEQERKRNEEKDRGKEKKATPSVSERELFEVLKQRSKTAGINLSKLKKQEKR